MIPALDRFAWGVHVLSDRVNRRVEWALFAIGFGVAWLMGVQVFCRYVLNHSLFWSEEVGRIALVWISFLGGSAAYKRRAHIGIDFAVRRLSPPLRRRIELVVVLASMVFFLILIGYGFAFARFVVDQKTAALGLSRALPCAVIPLSGVLFLVHGLSHLMQLFDLGDR